MQEYDVNRLVIAQLETLGFTPPHQPKTADNKENPAYDAMLELYRRDLIGYTPQQYERGMVEFRRTWTYTRWPKIAEVRKFFDAERAADREAEAAAKPKAIPDWKRRKEPPTEEERARVAKKMQRLFSDIGESPRRMPGIAKPARPSAPNVTVPGGPGSRAAQAATEQPTTVTDSVTDRDQSEEAADGQM